MSINFLSNYDVAERRTWFSMSNALASLLWTCPNCGNPMWSRCDTCSGRESNYWACWCGSPAIGPHGICAKHL
jgi:predicted RNA-binding Zn-ribbon protein involved in translation (DUF1610 family)